MTSKQVSKLDVTNLAVMPAYIETETGEGISTRADDNTVPYIKLLQKGSPEVNKNESAYIEGAEAGAILLRGSPDPLIDGEEGIIFQPCYHHVAWVEWLPDRGGYVNSYDRESPPEDMVEEDDDGKRIFLRKNGHEMVETGYYAGYVYREGHPAEQFVISLSSTGHKFRKQFMSMMNRKVNSNGEPASVYTSLYRLTTQYNSKGDWNWYTWSVKDHAWATPEQVIAAKRLYKQLASGAKTMEVATSADAGGDDDADDVEIVEA